MTEEGSAPSLGELLLEIGIDPSRYEEGLEAARERAIAFGQELEAIASLKLEAIAINVDDSALTELNQHLTLKERHIEQVNQRIVKPKVDESALTSLERKVEAVGKKIKEIAALTTGITGQGGRSYLGDAESSKAGIIQQGNREIVRELKSLQSATREAGKQGTGIFGGIISGIGQQFGFRVSTGIQTALKQSFNFDAARSASNATNRVISPVKTFVTENPQLQKVFEEQSAKFEEKLRKIGYVFGDSLIEALESEGTTARQKLGMFFENAINAEEFRKEVSGIKGEAANAGVEIGKALLRKDLIEEFFSDLDVNLRKYREVAIAERAIPLVQQRASEILQKKSAKNTGKVVTEDTEELVITIGGYAGARGLSGAALAKQLKADPQFAERNAEVIWVANKDTDISESARNSTPNKFLEQLGVTMGPEWLQEVGLSIAKPNIRGYSKDAVEIAAQATVASQKNPDIQIKILGESGGGFAAEEAAKILEMMGIKNVSFLGVGTPEFVGGLNAPGQKIISPDEPVGAMAHSLSSYGAARVDSPRQNILGVKEHPVRGYRQAEAGELMDFVFGNAKQMSKADVEALLAQAKEDAFENFGQMSPGRMKATAEQALENMQYVRRLLLNASEDTAESLQEIMNLYKEVYLKTARNPSSEPPSMAHAREMIKEAQEVFAEAQANPGIESGMKASEMRDRLKEAHAKFMRGKTQYDGTLMQYTGTLAEKHDLIAKEMEAMLRSLSSPETATARVGASSASATPDIYRRIAQEAADISGVNLTDENLPRLIANPELKGDQSGKYRRESNSIDVSPELLRLAQSGALSREQTGLLAHEIRHAFQTNFGKNAVNDPAIPLIKPDFDEARKLGERIEGSAEGKSRAVAALEADAYTFEERFGGQIFDKITKENTLQKLEETIGIAGGKLENRLLAVLIKTQEAIAGISNTFTRVDISDEVQQATARLQSMRNEMSQTLESLRDIEVLPVDEILNVQQGILETFDRLTREAPQVAREFASEVEAKPDRLRKEARDVMGMLNRKRDLEPIARERGIETKGLNRNQLIDQLSNVEDIGTLHEQVMGVSRQRAQQRLARQERIQDVAETAGGIAKGTIDTGQRAIEGFAYVLNGARRTFAPMLAAADESTKGLRQLASAVYQGAKQAENLTLTLIPYGHLIKGTVQNVALPAATFTAATHLLPGGQMVGEGLTHLAQTGLSPIAHAGGDALISSAQGMIQGAVPNFMGLQGAVTTLVTNAIETGVNAGVQILGTAGAAIVGGKTIQNVATAPVRAIAGSSQPSVPALPPANQPKALPGVQYRITGGRQAQQETPQTQALPALPSAQEVQEAVGRATGKQAELIETMVQDMKTLEKSLSTKRQELRMAIKKKDDRALNELPEEVEDLNKRLSGYLEQVQNLVKEAGDRAFGAIGLTNIGGIKGRQTQRQKGLDQDIQQARKIRGDQVPTDAIDVSNVEVPLPELKTPVNIPVPEMATIDVDVLQSVESLKAAFDSLTRKVIEVAKSDQGKAAIKDLAVNTAGFAVSQVGGEAGLVGSVGADIVGALTARLSINAGIAFKRAVEKLDPDTLKSANLAEKLNQIMGAFAEEFQSEAMQALNSEDLFGDITGFIIGQATNALTGITGSGAVAAMAGVPQLKKVRETVGRSPIDEVSPDIQELLKDLNDFVEQTADLGSTVTNSDDALRSVEGLSTTWNNLVSRIKVVQQEIASGGDREINNPEMNLIRNRQSTPKAETPPEPPEPSTSGRPGDGFVAEAGFEIKKLFETLQPVQAIKQQFQELDEMTGGLLSRVNGLGKAFVGLLVIGMAIGPINEFTQASLQAAINLESLEQRASFAFGSVASGSQALQVAADTAKRYGNDLNAARESYLQLAQATQGTRLEGFQTEQIFNATQIAQRALGLPQEQVERINTAFAQIAGKGKAQAEELRGQLGEAGISFNLMARAVGVSTQELDRMLERGEVFSDDFLPKLASQIESEMGMAALNAANTTQGALNNLGNEFLKLQETVGKAMLPLQNITISIATKGLEFLQAALPAILGLLSTLTAVLAGKVAASFGIASLSAISFGKVLAGLKFAASGLWKLLGTPLGSLGTAGLTAGFMGLFAILDMFKSVFQDAGAESKKFAQEVRKSMEDYKKALADARRPPEQNDRGRSRVTSGDNSQPSNLEQNIVGGSIIAVAGLLGSQSSDFMREQVRAYEQSIQQDLRNTFGNRSFQLGGMQITPGATTGDVRNAQLIEGDRVLLDTIGGVSTEINEQVAAFRTRGRDSDIGRLRAIDEQLADVQSRRRTLDPSDTQGRRAIDEEVDGLLRQRETAARPLARLSGIQAGNIEELQRKIQEATEDGDSQRVELLQSELRKAQESLDNLNASVRTTTNSVGLMVREFSKIEGELKKAVAQIEIFDARSRRAIATDIISGDMSQGQADFAQMIAQQETLGKRVEANLKAIREQTNMLQSGDNMEILEQTGLSLQSTPEEIRNRASALSEGSQERERLDAVADQVERLRDLNVETENLQTQIEESRAQAVTRLREAAQQIAEFYQGIEQQSRELQLETQRIQQQNRTQQAQNTLRGALLGFQESFIGSFVESLVNIIETLNRPLDEAINAQQTILQAQQTYIQQVRQAYQMQQNLPTDADVQALGEIEGVQQAPGIATPGMSTASGQMGAIAPSTPPIPGGAMTSGRTQAIVTAPTGQPDARGIITQADAMQRLSPQQAAMLGRQGLQQAVGLAGQNYQQTVANAQSRLQQARENSQIEAQIQMDQANFGLVQAQRQMADQQRGFDRGLQSMSGQNNPIASLRNEFDDSMRSMETFRRGLLQTIEQAQQSRMRIVEGVEAGLLPREMLQLLPELDNTLQAANTRLGELFSTQAKYQQAFKAQVQFLQEQQDFQVNQQLTQGRSQIFRAQAESDRIRQDEGSATVNDSAAQGAEIGSQLAERINELRLMRREGRLTEDQFNQLAGQARDFANISLDNVRQQLRRVRAESVSSALSAQGENPDREEMRENIDRMNRRAQLARRFGLISEEESTQFRRAGTLASSAIRGSQSDDAILRQLTSGEGRDNPYFAQMVEQMGRGDLVQLARLGSAGVLGNSNAAMTSQFNQASSNGQQRSPTGAPVAAQVDTIIGLMQEMLPAMRNSRGGSVTINANNANEGMNAYGQFRRDELKAANL